MISIPLFRRMIFSKKFETFWNHAFRSSRQIACGLTSAMNRPPRRLMGRNQRAWPDAGRLKYDLPILRRDEMSDIR